MPGAVVSIAFGNLASKMLGALREVMFAAWFGVGETAAAFRIAQTAFLVPIHGLVGESLSAGLLPLYRKMQAENSGAAAALLAVALSIALICAGTITACLYLFAGRVVSLVAPGASLQVLTLATGLLKILSLAAPFYVMGGVLAYIEAAHGRFSGIAWRPLALNLGGIAGAVVAVWTGNADWLATGLLIGYALFFGWTLAQCRRLTSAAFEFPQVALIATSWARLWRNTLPLLGLPLLTQLNVVAERVVASWMGTAVLPSIDYARFVSETAVLLLAFPAGVMTMAAHGGSSTHESRRHVHAVLATLMLISFPMSAFLAQNAEALVALLFARGQFGADAVSTTSTMLVWLGGGTGAAVTGFYLLKVLNSELRNKEALAITFVAVAVNVAVNLLLWRTVGTAALGIGSASFAFVVLLLSVMRLRLFAGCATLTLWLALGCSAQLILTSLLVVRFPPGASLFVAGTVAVTIWALLYFAIPAVKTAGRPVVMRVPILKRAADFSIFSARASDPA